jgi:endonuclease/exonuclease/phosphatase family metal-dependent hydrolase
MWRYAAAVLAVAAFARAARCDAGDAVRVMTFNIRYGTAPDKGNAWPRRRELAAKAIRDFSPDVLGVQEALDGQLDELAEILPEYGQIGVGREADGGGEYSAILFRRTRFDLHAADTFWLSDTPMAPGSKTWGNELPRVCTWARLVDRGARQRFYVFNTHWDHQSQPAREKSGQLLAAQVAQRVGGDEPAIVMGDFNAGEDDPCLAALMGQGGALRDTFRELHAQERGAGTFHGFLGVAGERKIDAVLVTPHWHTIEAGIVRMNDGGRYPSDHYPVTAIIELKPQAAQP